MLRATLESLVNRGLTRSLRARTLCGELAGKSVAVEVRDFLRVRLASSGSALTVTRDAEPADATRLAAP